MTGAVIAAWIAAAALSALVNAYITAWSGRRQRETELVVSSLTHFVGGSQERSAANLFFHLVSSRYEHASLVLTSNLPFRGWGGVFGDQAVAAAMIDRIVHHADVLTLKGASYRLRGKGIDSLPSIRTTTSDTPN
ncbi:MAG TPA: ATP-binding protein [Streptosporangiaceae bacterium]|jgi:hypothetical protein|nr:ATP-binding protein [Streptosporangiaceae bacterium]